MRNKYFWIAKSLPKKYGIILLYTISKLHEPDDNDNYEISTANPTRLNTHSSTGDKPRKSWGSQQNGTHERTKHQIHWKIMEMKLTHITMIIKNSPENKINAGEKRIMHIWMNPKKKKNAYARSIIVIINGKIWKQQFENFVFRFNTCYGLYMYYFPFPFTLVLSLRCQLCSNVFPNNLQSLLLLLSLFYYRNRASDECEGGKLRENTI